MRKNGALLLSLLVLSACATVKEKCVDGMCQPVDVSDLGPGTPQFTETEASAPGMIPSSCESLFQKANEWGYTPGNRWKPASSEQALAVADFFADFTLVPDASSRAYREWMNEAPAKSRAEAKASLKKLETIQVCDLGMTMFFLEALLKYPWPKAMRDQVGKDLHRFVLNQQARTAPLGPRALTVHVLQGAREKRLMPGSAAAAAKVRNEVQAAKLSIAPGEAKPEDLEWAIEKSLRKELQLSEAIREKLGQQLPMP